MNKLDVLKHVFIAIPNVEATSIFKTFIQSEFNKTLPTPAILISSDVKELPSDMFNTPHLNESTTTSTVGIFIVKDDSLLRFISTINDYIKLSIYHPLPIPNLFKVGGYFHHVPCEFPAPTTDVSNDFFSKMGALAHDMRAIDDGYVWQGDYLKTGKNDCFIYYRHDYDNNQIELNVLTSHLIYKEINQILTGEFIDELVDLFDNFKIPVGVDKLASVQIRAKLLKINKMEIDQLEGFDIDSDLPEVIAELIKNTYSEESLNPNILLSKHFANFAINT